VHAATIAHSRYHLPLMPLVALFAARLLVTRREPLPRRRLRGAAAAASILASFWVVNFVREDGPDLERRLGRSAASRAPAGAAPAAPSRESDR
jgi:hypothetical protein